MKSGKNDLLPPPDPPAGLSEYAAGIWRRVVTRHADRISPGRLEALHLAFELLDDYRTLRETIRAEGFTVESKRSGLQRRHPLLDSYFRIQKELIKTWKNLNLNWDVDVDGRSNW